MNKNQRAIRKAATKAFRVTGDQHVNGRLISQTHQPRRNRGPKVAGPQAQALARRIKESRS